MTDDRFQQAIREWLKYGEDSCIPVMGARVAKGHMGYFSPGGWAYEELKRLAADLSLDKTCGNCEYIDTSHAVEGTGACFGPNGCIGGWVPLHASCGKWEKK